ncbi:PIN domain-containing protein [Hymenobacter canadensis]|uniref:Ribonuclease VapC n=1 Tax=Hymenobacter canadensis TaxID=2999067 RepID=A0ABY7LLJ8_9BACT|nr:PIN domain-containing protein [Hymenobacter canadensis]WBA41329.1 PIN domain-containing protein [Hymenobacter canadensis]
MPYLLDTDICIKLMRRHPNVVAHFFSAGGTACFISEITLAELRYGAEFSQRPAHHHAEANRLQQAVQVLPIDKAITTFAAEKARLRRAGLLLPDFDLLIGATALAYDMALVTNNTAHLSRLAGLTLENWLTDPLPS